MRADHEIGPPESDLSVTPGESRWAFSESQPKVGSGPGIHLAHNSAKLKIINLPKHYPVVKVRPLRPRQDLAGPASPAVRWSVSQCSRIRGTMVLWTQNGDSICSSRRSHSTCARLGLCAPIFTFRCSWPAFLPPHLSSVVETRRLELLTLSLQRRCSAN